MDEQSLFVAALERDEAQRQAYLDEVCPDDPALRQRVERLLAAHQHAASYLDQPAVAPAPTVEHPATERAGAQIGPYKRLQKLGEGGMGVVYLAEQQRPVKRRVAVKIIKPGMDSRQVIARFEAERQALALMDHPNIARVLDAGCTDSGRPYFVMELVKGIPITQFCDQNRLSARQRLELLVPVCQAVQHAHQKGIIHRDIKPSNILVALYDDRPVPKIIDFGVAKATHQQLTEKTLFTQVGQIVGTWQYMSPEQAVLNQLDVDTRTDIYSLGVVLYELLTGVTPLESDRIRSAALEETLRLIREHDPPKPSTRISSLGERATSTAAHRGTDAASLARTLRGDMDWIVMKALEKSRSRRYETASGLAADLQRYLQEEPIEARPPSTAYRLRKAALRHRAAVVATAAVAVTLIVATAASIGLAVSAWRAQQQYRLVLVELRQELADRAMDSAFSGDLAGARDAIHKAGIAGAPPDLLQTLDGLAFFFDGDNEQAIARLEKASADAPNSLSALSALWWAYRNSFDLSNMYRVEKLIKERRLKPKDRYEDLFVCLIQSVSSPAERIGGVIQRLDKMIQQRDRWGAAYAIRAAAKRERGLESLKLDDFRQAIDDFGQAEVLLRSSPFVLAMGLSILSDGIELAAHEGNSAQAKQWRKRADGIAAKLEKRPDHMKARHNLASFYYLTDQVEKAKAVEDEFLKRGGANVIFTRAAADFRGHRCAELERRLRAQVAAPEAAICLANLLAEKSDEGRKEAMEIFRDIQQRNIQAGLKCLAMSIPLLAGRLDGARQASQQLLASNVLSQEWRWFKYEMEYHAKEMNEDELLRRAGPFSGSRCMVNFAIAMESLARGNREKAKRHFQQTVATGRVGWYDHSWARTFLERLNEDETWPSWIPPKEDD